MLTLTKKKAREQFVWGWALILPTIIGLVILNIIPIFQTIYLTFFKTGAFGLNNIFIGLANYKKAFNDVIILKAIRNTFIYMLLEVPASIIISLLLAFILNQKNEITRILPYSDFLADGGSSGSRSHGVEMAV